MKDTWIQLDKSPLFPRFARLTPHGGKSVASVSMKKFFRSVRLSKVMSPGENDRQKAWIDSQYTDNLEEMIVQLHRPGRPLDTHFLYLNIARISYGRRSDQQMRELFKKTAIEHISQFINFIQPLRKLCKTSEGSILPRVPTFQMLATVYTEGGEYEKAIEVCNKAIRFGLHDGTKGDYQARMGRIKKKAAQMGIEILYEPPSNNGFEYKDLNEDIPGDVEGSSRKKTERLIEVLEGKNGEDARQKEIDRLASGWRERLGR